jgi:hypothetical protein
VLRPLPSLRAAMRRGVTRKVDKLATVRIGSARYSVPPGGTSILDEHYDRPARKPQRAVRPRTRAEKDFLALGEEAVAFLRAAAAAGTTRLPAHIADIAALRAAHGAEALTAALRRAVEFRRFTAEDVRAILAAGPAAPTPAPAGQALPGPLPAVPTRGLEVYRTDELKEAA